MNVLREQDLVNFSVAEQDEENLVFEAQDGIQKMLDFCGENISRSGLEKTPYRVVKAFYEQTWGLRTSKEDFLKSISTDFDVHYDQMVVLKCLHFSSICEHHLLPIIGKAYVAYIPNAENSRVLGISKLARIVEYCAARPQVQERLTHDIANLVNEVTLAIGVGVLIEGLHTCMSTRGVRSTEAIMITSALSGVLKTNSDSRREFLQIVASNNDHGFVV